MKINASFVGALEHLELDSSGEGLALIQLSLPALINRTLGKEKYAIAAHFLL